MDYCISSRERRSEPSDIFSSQSRGTSRHNSHHTKSEPDATAERWSRCMPHIKRLYIDEQLSLKQVAKIMARDHNFHASEKMYKKHLRSTGIKKNVSMSDEDVMRILKLLSHGRHAEESGLGAVDDTIRLASGQVVGVKRLETHLVRKGITVDNYWKKLDASSWKLYQSSPGPVPHIDAPDVYRLPELVFSSTARYVAARFSTGPALLNRELRGPADPIAIQAHATIDDAACLLGEGKLEDAIILLKTAPERLKLLLGAGQCEPPMTLFLVWKMIVALLLSAAMAGIEVEGLVKSLVRYTATIATASASISPQLRRIIGALAEMSHSGDSLMLDTAFRGCLCMHAQQGLAIGTPESIYSSVQLTSRRWYATQRWIANLESLIWPSWKRSVQIHGESSPEAIAALHSLLLVLERQQQGSQRKPNKRFRLAVEQTLRKIPDDGALAVAHGDAHVKWAIANMSQQNDKPELPEVYMAEALEMGKRREETTLYELHALRVWLLYSVDELQA